MVKWDNDKNVYILSAALAALNASINNEIAETVIAGWPTSTLGEPPTLRAVRDQIKKLSSSSFSSVSAAPTAKTGVKKARAVEGKGRGNKGQKRVRDDDDDEEEAEDEEKAEDEGGEGGLAKKQKIAVKQEEVEEDENEDAEV